MELEPELIKFIGTLSDISKEYIPKTLLPNEDHYVKKHISSRKTPRDEDEKYIIGTLSPYEKRLYLILISLKLRLEGVNKRRIDYDEKEEDELLIEFQEKRLKRIPELISDIKKTTNKFNTAVKKRLSEKISSVLAKNKDLIKEESRYDLMDRITSGHIIDVLSNQEMILCNKYAPSGY